MSIYASQTQDTITVSGVPVLIKKLTARQIEAAQRAHIKAIAESPDGFTARGWSGMFRRQLAKGINAVTDADVTKMLADPLNGFDRHTVAKYGVLLLNGAELTPLPPTAPEDAIPEQIEDLGDDELEAIALGVMKLSKPSLFLTPEEREAATKKG